MRQSGWWFAGVVALVTTIGAAVAVLDTRYLSSAAFADHELIASASNIQIATALTAVAQSIKAAERHRKLDRIEDINEAVYQLRILGVPPEYIDRMKARGVRETLELEGT